ncbi:MAG: arginine ABC transporter ATP-binding protein ArtP [Arsenophonus endosymbiont of Ceratovacuna japonica]
MSIKLSQINCFYGKEQSLHNINLTCETGEIVILLGPSGAGKSSLLRVFNLLHIPQSGKLDIVGYHFNLSNKPKKHIIRIIRKKVGMVFQQYHLWPHLTVMENLIKAPYLVLGLTKTVVKEKAINLLNRLRLTEYANNFPLHLSGGQQQRVAIARALMMEPEVLLFDEPTSALDPEITIQVFNIIKELSKIGITQLIVTHEIDFIRKIASKIIYMEKGSIIEQGNINHFITPQTKGLKNYISHLSK